MKVRAKFVVQSVTEHNTYTGGCYKDVKMNPVMADDVEENKRFHEATPSGEIKMTITNPSAADAFKPGDTFYVDFIEA